MSNLCPSLYTLAGNLFVSVRLSCRPIGLQWRDVTDVAFLGVHASRPGESCLHDIASYRGGARDIIARTGLCVAVPSVTRSASALPTERVFLSRVLYFYAGSKCFSVFARVQTGTLSKCRSTLADSRISKVRECHRDRDISHIRSNVSKNTSNKLPR